jgi:hypothetical protein
MTRYTFDSQNSTDISQLMYEGLLSDTVERINVSHGDETLKQYVFVDSWNKSPTSDTARGEICFQLRVGVTDSLNFSLGVPQGLTSVTDAILFPFYFPYLEDVTYQTNTAANGLLPRLVSNGGAPTTFSQSAFNGVLSLEITELSQQAFSGRKASRFHYPIQAWTEVAGSTARNARAVKGCETLHFNTPIHALNSLTLIFRNPDSRVKLPKDVFYSGNDLVLKRQAAGTFVEIHATAHNLVAGDRIYFEGINSDVSGRPVVNNYLCNSNGLLVGSSGITASVSFRLNPDVDISAFVGVGEIFTSTTQIRMFVAKNRIIIPMQFVTQK